jgi:hypothetical protein
LGIKLEQRGLGTHQVDIHIQGTHARNTRLVRYWEPSNHMLVDSVVDWDNSCTSDILGLRG